MRMDVGARVHVEVSCDAAETLSVAIIRYPEDNRVL